MFVAKISGPESHWWGSGLTDRHNCAGVEDIVNGFGNCRGSEREMSALPLLRSEWPRVQRWREIPEFAPQLVGVFLPLLPSHVSDGLTVAPVGFFPRGYARR